MAEWLVGLVLLFDRLGGRRAGLETQQHQEGRRCGFNPPQALMHFIFNEIMKITIDWGINKISMFVIKQQIPEKYEEGNKYHQYFYSLGKTNRNILIYFFFFFTFVCVYYIVKFSMLSNVLEMCYLTSTWVKFF